MTYHLVKLPPITPQTARHPPPKTRLPPTLPLAKPAYLTHPHAPTTSHPRIPRYLDARMPFQQVPRVLLDYGIQLAVCGGERVERVCAQREAERWVRVGEDVEEEFGGEGVEASHFGLGLFERSRWKGERVSGTCGPCGRAHVRSVFFLGGFFAGGRWLAVSGCRFGW